MKLHNKTYYTRSLSGQKQKRRDDDVNICVWEFQFSVKKKSSFVQVANPFPFI